MPEYNRGAAVRYAHRWAHGRNPAYYNFDNLGGDCTNFVSQCLHAGGAAMNYTQTFGWYYINANRKAPAWTGVPYLYNFLSRTSGGAGPRAGICRLDELLPGDLVQLLFHGEVFQHTPIVVEARPPFTPADILVAAHTQDADNRPLSTYSYRRIRPLHIESA